jgi:hypothetical protein
VSKYSDQIACEAYQMGKQPHQDWSVDEAADSVGLVSLIQSFVKGLMLLFKTKWNKFQS